MKPVVSIVMPAYNAEKYLDTAILSVVEQSFNNWELIIVDDGSLDTTPEVINNWQQRDDRISSIRQSNSGRPACARNAGLDIVSGDFISFLDADDFYDRKRIEMTLEVFEKFPNVQVAFHDLYLEDEFGKIRDTTYLQLAEFIELVDEYTLYRDGDIWQFSDRYWVFVALYYAGMHTGTVMFRSDLCKKNALRFNQELTIGEDTELWCRIAEMGAVAFLDKPLATYRMHGSGITSDTQKYVRGRLETCQMIFDRIESRLTNWEHRAFLAKLSEYKNDLAYSYLCEGKNVEAMKLYLAALENSSEKTKILLGLIKSLMPWKQFRRLKHGTH
mgnify:CR=1 FL=1